MAAQNLYTWQPNEVMYEASIKVNALISFTSEPLVEMQSIMNRHSFKFYLTAIPVLTT